MKPFDTVNFVNGGNTTAVVTTAADGTTSDVTFNVTGLPITYTTADGKPVSKVGDKYYPVNEKGQPIGPDNKPAVKTAPNGDLLDEAGNVIQPINTATNPLKSNLVNPNVANSETAPNNQTTSPTQLGNVANGANTFDPVDGKKLGNDGKWYNAADVLPNGQPKENVQPVAKPENVGKAGLIDFSNSNPNNAATVGDLQNLGFVVAAKDNGYVDQVRNANKVEFKGSNGVEVTGKTLEDGTREITVGLKEGKVTNDVTITKPDGTETHAVRGEDGKIYEKDPVTGKATTTEIPVAPTDTVTNDGNSFVTGNTVATAIQKSGWNIGIGSTDKAFSTEAKAFEKVNPNDNVKYVNGANTTVSMAVDEAEDHDGATVTTTYVKVDVNRDLYIDSVTAGGPAKDGKAGKDGAMTVKDAQGKDGVSATATNGKGTLTLQDANTNSKVDISTGKAPADLANTPKDGTPVPTMDRIQYAGKDGKVHNVATMNDGLRFVGDDDKSIDKPLNSTLTLTGGNREDTGKPVAKDATTTGNIGVFNTDGKLSIQLAKDLEKMSSANFENPDGTSTKITGNGVSITPETAILKDPKTKKPILDKDGNPKVDPTKIVSFGAPTIVRDEKGNPVVNEKGEPVMKSNISAGGQVISNVAPGVADTDAVNVSQLKGVANNINMRMNRMGAQAAAMGALRHLQYDPLEPTTIMAGVGAYKGEAALALGIAHYKNESTLFHAGASIGSRGDELMANAGVSWKFGSRADETAVKDTFRQGPISSSYTLQDKVSALEAQNQVQKDEINNLKAQLAEVLQYVKKG